MALPKVLANFTTSLASKITSSATSMTLSRSTDPDGTTLAGQYIVTVDEGTSAEEHMLVTLAGATATIDTRGLSKVDMSTSVSGNKFAHDRGAEVKITNAVLVRVINELNGVTSTSAMVGTTGTAWRIGNGTDQDAFVYAQNADAAKPFVKYDKTLNKWLISNDGTTTYDITAGGSGLSAGSGVTISASTINSKLNASGLLSASLGAGSDELGLVTDISAALAGTSGTPSAGNKFVTASDVSVSGSASKIVRMNGSGVVAGSVLGLTATGDMAYFNGSGMTRLTSSTSYAVPVMNSGGTAVLWGYPDFLSGVGLRATKGWWVFPYSFGNGTGLFSASAGSTEYYNSFLSFTHTTGANLVTNRSIFRLDSTYGSTGGIFWSSKKVIMEMGAICNSLTTGQKGFGLASGGGVFNTYNSASVKAVCFTIDASSNLYAHTSNGGGGADHTETLISGVTLTDMNTYRIEFDPGVEARFYVNGTLKATVTTTLPSGSTNGSQVLWGCGVDQSMVLNVVNLQFAVEK